MLIAIGMVFLLGLCLGIAFRWRALGWVAMCTFAVTMVMVFFVSSVWHPGESVTRNPVGGFLIMFPALFLGLPAFVGAALGALLGRLGRPAPAGDRPGEAERDVPAP